MHLKIKKNHWLVIISVLLFLAMVYIAVITVRAFNIIKAQKSAAVKEIQMVELSSPKVWRGKVLDKPARLIGDYIVFRVEYLTNKQEKSQISVIFKPNFKWSQTNSRDFNIGDEILFFQVIFTFEKGEKEALFCPIGIHVANPPKKK